MRKALSTLTAATAGLGVMVGAPSAAHHAFVPAAVVAAWAVGAGLTGLFVGSAVTNNAYTTGVVAPAPAVTPALAVTVGSTTCYFTRAWVGNAWRRVQVCNNY